MASSVAHPSLLSKPPNKTVSNFEIGRIDTSVTAVERQWADPTEIVLAARRLVEHMLPEHQADLAADSESPAREAAFRFASLDYPATERRFNCYYAEFLPVATEKLRPHDHAGVEFIYVIHGILSVHMNAEEHVLEAGDAIYFDATIPHAYRRRGGRLCSAVVVTAA